jgi:hypothetical protein
MTDTLFSDKIENILHALLSYDVLLLCFVVLVAYQVHVEPSQEIITVLIYLMI